MFMFTRVKMLDLLLFIYLLSDIFCKHQMYSILYVWLGIFVIGGFLYTRKALLQLRTTYKSTTIVSLIVNWL